MTPEPSQYRDNAEHLASALAKLSSGSADDAIASLLALKHSIESSADEKSRTLLPAINDQIASATRPARQTPKLTRGHWWKLPLTFVGLLLTPLGH